MSELRLNKLHVLSCFLLGISLGFGAPAGRNLSWSAPEILGIKLGGTRQVFEESCRKHDLNWKPFLEYDPKTKSMRESEKTLEVDGALDGCKVYVSFIEDRVWLVTVNRDNEDVEEALSLERKVFAGLKPFSENITAGLREYRGKDWSGEFTWSDAKPFSCRAAVYAPVSEAKGPGKND